MVEAKAIKDLLDIVRYSPKYLRAWPPPAAYTVFSCSKDLPYQPLFPKEKMDLLSVYLEGKQPVFFDKQRDAAFYLQVSEDWLFGFRQGLEHTNKFIQDYRWGKAQTEEGNKLQQEARQRSVDGFMLGKSYRYLVMESIENDRKEKHT
ncbi:MAG: hypothetical protein AABY22_01285 [Nanoarchaeota archaeon]